MGEKTKIQWTDHTFNPWRGCTHVHAGCANCYAEAMSKRNPKTLGVWGPNGTRVVASESMWAQPIKWNEQAKKEGVRRRVFCASLADIFEDWQGDIVNSKGEVVCSIGTFRATMEDLRNLLFDMIDRTPNLDWLLVTKRPENIRRMWPRHNFYKDAKELEAIGLPHHLAGDLAATRTAYRSNVWLLTSVSDQTTADAMVPRLRDCRDLVPVLGLSIEPILGPIDISVGWMKQLDWIIVGGESGPHARECNTDWIRAIVGWCFVNGVPVFVKQLGSVAGGTVVVPHDGNFTSEYQRFTLSDPKGGDLAEWAKDLRVREFPEVKQ